MTRPLVRTQRTIETRLRRLEQRVNEELGLYDQRLRFTKRALRAGPIKWALDNKQVEEAGLTLPQNVAAELAAATNDESILYFGYNEEWQPARGRDQIEFVSSNLRFVIAGVEEMPDLQFRLEWAGARTERGTVAYPGRGAAHPHWQFDVDDGWKIANGTGPVSTEAIEIDLEPRIEEIELDLEGRTTPLAQVERGVSATLAGFHHLHLPARTMWHELQCVMPDVASPQQHTPENEEQIDRWVISALRYLRSEFQTYL